MNQFDIDSDVKEKAVRKWRRLFGHPTFWMVVFLLALVLFCWPFLVSPHEWSIRDLYRFIFSSWVVVIVLILVIGGSLPPATTGEGGDSRKD